MAYMPMIQYTYCTIESLHTLKKENEKIQEASGESLHLIIHNVFYTHSYTPFIDISYSFNFIFARK